MDLDLRRRFGVTVVAIRRADGRLDLNLKGDTQIYGGDVLILLGKPENLDKALEWLEKVQEGKVSV